MTNPSAYAAGVTSASSCCPDLPVATYTIFSDSKDGDTSKSRPHRTSRRRLRGPVTVVFSTRVRFPRLHLDEQCDTLEATPMQARGHLHFENALDLGTFEEGRPCRVCCLEPVLRAALKTTMVPVVDPVVFTASAQACPTRQDGNIQSFDWGNASESSQQRLRRVARTVGLPVCGTSAGLVIYGIRDRRSVEVVRMNLRTAVAKAADTEVGELTVQTLWTLLNDNPPELSSSDLDVWDMAAMLSR